jgi:hypothetical protein
MSIRARHITSFLVVFIALAAIYIVLARIYRSSNPADIAKCVISGGWQVDSIVVIRQPFVHYGEKGMQPNASLRSYSLSLYGKNTVSNTLLLDSLSLYDSSCTKKIAKLHMFFYPFTNSTRILGGSRIALQFEFEYPDWQSDFADIERLRDQSFDNRTMELIIHSSSGVRRLRPTFYRVNNVMVLRDEN